MRYAPEWNALEGGSWEWITSTAIKTWERYGIHALEPAMRILGPGFSAVSSVRQGTSTLFNLRHVCGTIVTCAVLPDALPSFAVVHAYGNSNHQCVTAKDTYSAFRTQMEGFLRYAAELGSEPVPFAETVELMAALIAGRSSQQCGGGEIAVAPIVNSAFMEGKVS